MSMSYSLIALTLMVYPALTISPVFLMYKCSVPMEEIVRAFNYVIEKGWVRRVIVPPSLNLKIIRFCAFRHSTGLHRNGQPARSKKPIVRLPLSSPLNLID
jgi:hypothetical protein